MSSLRNQIALVILVLGVLPLGVGGWWLTQELEDSATAEVQRQLDQGLTETARQIRSRWIARRSELLDLIHRSGIRAIFHGRPTGNTTRSRREIRRLLRGAEETTGVAKLTLRDTTGSVLASVRRLPTDGTESSGPEFDLIPVTLPIHEPGVGEKIGSLEVFLRPEALLPPGMRNSFLQSGVLAISTSNGVLLTPLPFPRELLGGESFAWAGERWTSVQRVLQSPDLHLAAATPLTPILSPLAEAITSGAWLLFGVAIALLSALALIVRNVTGPLSRLVHASEAVAEGNLAITLDESQGPLELRRLTEAFDHMVQRLQNTLDELSRRKVLSSLGRMAGTLAHEIRNPLASIQTDLQASRRRTTDSSVDRSLQRALSQIRRMDRTVEDVLRLARSGEPEREPIALRTLLDQIVETIGDSRFDHEANITFSAAVEEIPSLEIRADMNALSRALLNLLENAVEASPEGGSVRISVERSEDCVHVRIHDDGRGIPPDIQDEAIKPFVTTRSQGTGLGLSIAHQIIEAHGGELILDSEVGKGTTATVVLPVS